MKKNLIATCMFMTALNLAAQWNPFAGAVGVPADRNGNTTIGPSTGVSTPPLYQLDIEPSTNAGDGVRIWNNLGNNPRLMLDNLFGGTKWHLESFNAPSRFEIFDGNGGTGRFTIDAANGYCGVNTSGPGNRFHVESSIAGEGLLIRNTAGDAHLFLDNNAGSVWSMNNDATSNYEISENGSPFIHINSGSGDVGIGSTGPASKLHIELNTAANNGARIRQNGAGDAALFIENAGTAGSWSLKTLGAASGGVPHFVIHDDVSNNDRFFIDGTAGGSGNVGINTSLPSTRLNVVESAPLTTSTGKFEFSTSSAATSTALIGQNISTGAGMTAHGISGYANAIGSSRAIGVLGTAVGTGATIITGGRFIANGGASGQNIGVLGFNNSTAAALNVGVYGDEGSNTAATYAGYFQGKAFVNGVTTLNGNTTINGSLLVTSDKRLKKEIREIENGIDRLQKLNPSQYYYRTDEIKGVNLPEGLQLGLIAQEVESVFPELVMTVNAHNVVDKDGSIIEVAEYKTVNYLGLIPVLIDAVKKQQSKIDQLEYNAKSSLTVGTDKNLGGIDKTMSMDANVPNPFTQETVIPYTIPSNIETAYLGVYDMTGKLVKTFVLTERGNSQIKISADNLAAGMYIYSIIADNKVVDAKRMIVAEK